MHQSHCKLPMRISQPATSVSASCRMHHSPPRSAARKGHKGISPEGRQPVEHMWHGGRPGDDAQQYRRNHSGHCMQAVRRQRPEVWRLASTALRCMGPSTACLWAKRFCY
jgi:hypothetical protein